MGSAFDFQASLLDEIALEGLDGITLEMLWQRIADRPEFPIALDEDSKNFFWDNIAKHKDIEIFKLPEPRKSLPIFNRYDYIDPELGVVIDHLEPIHDPYKPIVQINDGQIRGSCATYKTRICITSEIRCGNDVLLMSLDQTVMKWGETLVLVASPKLRLFTLIGTETNPLIDLTIEAYCLLERIGRSRYLGEVTQGNGGLLSLKAPFCKQIHYYRKKLSSKGLITKQMHYLKNKQGSTNNGCLFHLTRFYVHRKTKMASLVKRLCDVLKDKPQQRESCMVLKEELGVKDSTFKKLSYKPFQKWVKFITMTCRQFYPEGTKKDWFSLNGHEKIIRIVQMLKHCDDDGEEEEEEEDIDGKEKALPMNVHFDFTKINPRVPLIVQLYEHVYTAGPEGISAADLGRALTLPRLDIRGLLKALMKKDYIVSVLHDRGRQKVTKFIAKSLEEQNDAYSAVKEVEELETKAIYNVDSLKHSNNNKRSAGDEDEMATPAKKTKITVETEENIPEISLVNGDSEEKDDVSQVLEARNQSNVIGKYPKVINISDKPVVKPTPRKLTHRLIKRINMVCEHLESERVTTLGELQKYIKDKEREEGYAFLLDKKSLYRLVDNLYFNGKLKRYVAALELDNGYTQIEFICEKSLEKTDPRIQVCIEQVKFKNFGITKDSSKKVGSSLKEDSSGESQIKTEKTSKTSNIKGEVSKKPSMEVSTKAETLHKFPRMTPKFIRAKTLHTFLYYLVYEHKAELNTSSEQFVYHDSLTWKRYVPPLPDYGKNGWCFLADIYSRIPLSLFLKIVNFRQGIPGLNSYLENEDKANYLIKYLPQNLRNSLLNNRKYLFSTNDVIKVLCYMGLLSMGPQVGKQKDQIFIYIHKTGSVKDTTVSAPGYIHVKDDIEYETKNFRFQSEDDVINYWLDLENTSYHTPLGKFLVVAGKTLTITEANFKPQLMATLKNKGFDEVVDDFNIPGDGLGAAGYDSALFLHSRRNWQSPACGYKPPQVTKGKSSPVLKSLQHLLQVSDTNKPETRSRLQRITKNSLLLQKENKIKKSTNVKSNASQILPVGKRKKFSLRTIKLRTSKIRKTFYDEKDKQAIAKMDKARCDWSPQEDSFLLLCKVTSSFLDPLWVNNLVVPYTVVRDLLYENVPGPSANKSSRACQRRVRYMMTNPATINNVKIFLGEALQDKELVNEFSKSKPPKSNELVWKTLFTNALNKLLVKFTLPASDRCKNVVIPSSMIEFNKQFEILVDQDVIQHNVCYRAPQNIEDIKKCVLLSFILSAIAVENDGRKWSLLLHKVYQSYPEGYLQSVVQLLRKERIIAIKKKNSKIDVQRHSTTGPYKFSVTYSNAMLTKFPIKVFKESKDLLDNLKLLNSETNVELKGDIPPGYAASVLALVTMEQLVIHTQIPDQIILFDSSLSKEARSNIVERMVSTLSDVESMELTKLLNDGDTMEANDGFSVEGNRDSTETHSAVIHDSEMMNVDDSFSDINTDNDSQVHHFGCASRFALYLLRHEMSQPPIERVQHSQDYIVLNSCRVFCRLKPSNFPPLPVNPSDVIEKTSDWQKTAESEYITKEKMELSNERISEILKQLISYFPVDVFSINKNYNDTIEALYEQYSPQTVHDAQCIFHCIYNTSSKGILVKELWSLFTILSGELDVFEHLKIFCEAFIIIRAGVTEFTYACGSFASIWVVTSSQLSSFCQETQDKHPKSISYVPGSVSTVDSSSDDQNPCASCKLDNKHNNDLPIVSSSKQTSPNAKQKPVLENVYFLPRTWRTPDGNLNKTVFFELLTTILSHIISSPGLSPAQVCEQFSLILPPVHIFELIEILEKACCVYKYYCKPVKKASLFSAPSTIYITENPQPGDLEHIEPFPDAVCKINQLRNAIE